MWTSHLLHAGFLLVWFYPEDGSDTSSETSVHMRNTRRYIPEDSDIQIESWRMNILVHAEIIPFSRKLEIEGSRSPPPPKSSYVCIFELAHGNITDPEVRIRFPALPDFLRSSGPGTGSTEPRKYNWGATCKRDSGFGLESREYGRRDSLRWLSDTFYPQKSVLTSATGGSVGIGRSRTKATELLLLLLLLFAARNVLLNCLF
jgi:hypothetical protein